MTVLFIYEGGKLYFKEICERAQAASAVPIVFLFAGDYLDGKELFEQKSDEIDLAILEGYCNNDEPLYKDLLEQIKTKRPEVKVIAVSGSKDWREICLKNGFNNAIDTFNLESFLLEAVKNN
jgi:hypothetical protein